MQEEQEEEQGRPESISRLSLDHLLLLPSGSARLLGCVRMASTYVHGMALGPQTGKTGLTPAGPKAQARPKTQDPRPGLGPIQNRPRIFFPPTPPSISSHRHCHHSHLITTAFEYLLYLIPTRHSHPFIATFTRHLQHYQQPWLVETSANLPEQRTSRSRPTRSVRPCSPLPHFSHTLAKHTSKRWPFDSARRAKSSITVLWHIIPPCLLRR